MLLFFPLLLGSLHPSYSATSTSTSTHTHTEPDIPAAPSPPHLLRPTRSSGDSASRGAGLSVEPESVSVRRGGTASFHCAGKGPQPIHISWRKDGEPLRTEDPDSRLTKLENGTLVVRDVEGGRGGREDEGFYACVGTLEVGESTWRWISRKAQLRILVLPRFVEEPTDRTVKAGETILLPCRTEADPAPSVRWYKDDSLLPPSGPNHQVLPQTGSLHIFQASKEDSAAYRCKVSSADKYRESGTGRVKVEAETELSEPYAPRFEVKPESRVVGVGSQVVLECAANGYPEPEIEWLKDSRRLEVGGRLRMEGRGSLLIQSIGRSDAGVYTCRAVSSLDSVDATATLKVQLPPKITKAPADVTAKETSDVEFVCEAEGSPGPSIAWYKNAELIKPSQYFLIEGSSLKVLGLVKSDAGVYQCLASNPAGSVQSSAQLRVQVAELPDEPESGQGTAPSKPPPSQPRSLRASRWDSRSVTIQWSAPSTPNGAISHYAIFYKEADSDRERVHNATTTSARIDDLRPDRHYSFRVVAFNAHGAGPSSAPLKVRTKSEAATPGVVRDLSASATAPDSIHIAWEPPSEKGSPPVSFYKLFYAPSPSEESKTSADVETEIQVSRAAYTLHGLSAFTSYGFRVEAFTEEGSGGPSSPTITARTHSDVPKGPPLEVSLEPASSQSLLLSWAPPQVGLRNGRITGYKLRYKEKERGASEKQLTTDGSAREWKIGGLKPGSNYQVKVAAVTRNGTGPFSSWQRASTYDEELEEETVPGPPTSLRVQARPSAILISWTPPLEDGVPTRGFVIGWGINVPDVQQTKVDGSRRYHTIENLTPNRNYIVSLRAFNRRGNGFPIYETVRTEAADAEKAAGEEGAGTRTDIKLTPPIFLRAETKGPTEIRLSWSDPNLPPSLVPGAPQIPSDGRKYQIRFKSNYSPAARFHYVNASETMATLEGLKPATHYEFRVQVLLERSASGWSIIADNKTAAAAPTSAPRDLTAIQADDDPSSLLLSWQPPRHPNGPISEYLLYYTTRPRLPDREWELEGVRGDKLSLRLRDLLPETTYFFKIQAVSDKGYGPLSTVVQKRSGGGSAMAPPGKDSTASSSFLQDKTILAGIGGGLLLLLLILCCIVVWCCRRRRRGPASRNGYVAGKKTKAARMEVKPPPDLWIHQEHLRRGSADELEAQLHQTSSRGDNYVDDLKEYPSHSPGLYPDQQLRYQAHSEIGGRTSSAMMEMSSTLESRQVGRARPIRHAGASTADQDSARGTLTRSYHQSSGSLQDREPQSGRQRTPNVVYTGPRHGQHPSSVDLEGSALTPTPPPSLPPSTALLDPNNRTLTRSSNPLKSFSHLTAGLQPPAEGSSQSPTPARALVRPVPITVASPLRSHVGTSASGKPAGIVIGTKAVGVSSPRAPLNGAGGSYSDANPPSSYGEPKDEGDLHHSYSTEDLNVHMEQLDVLMGDLHAMSKNEFNCT